MPKETFGEVIKSARVLQGLSLRELARRVDISHPYLSQLENGHNDNPAPTIVLKLAEELDISFAYLIQLTSTEIGSKRLPENSYEILKILKPSDLESWDTFEEFKNHFKESEMYIDVNNPQYMNDKLMEIYEYLKFVKVVEETLKVKARSYSTINEVNDYLEKAGLGHFIKEAEEEVKKVQKERRNKYIKGLVNQIEEQIEGLFVENFNTKKMTLEELLLGYADSMEILVNDKPLNKKDKEKLVEMANIMFNKPE